MRHFIKRSNICRCQPKQEKSLFCLILPASLPPCIDLIRLVTRLLNLWITETESDVWLLVHMHHPDLRLWWRRLSARVTVSHRSMPWPQLRSVMWLLTDGFEGSGKQGWRLWVAEHRYPSAALMSPCASQTCSPWNSASQRNPNACWHASLPPPFSHKRRTFTAFGKRRRAYELLFQSSLEAVSELILDLLNESGEAQMHWN